MTIHDIIKEGGVILLMGDHLFRRITEWETDLEGAKKLFGRRKTDPKGDNKMALNWLEIIKEVISKSPELIPELKNIIADVEKTVADAEAIKTTVDPVTPA